MKIIRKSSALFIFALSSTISYAAWDQRCLDSCISTRHECNYCDYQCRVDDVEKTELDTGDSYRCPLPGY